MWKGHRRSSADPGDIYWHCNCKPLREKTLAFKLQKINNCTFVGFMLIAVKVSMEWKNLAQLLALLLWLLVVLRSSIPLYFYHSFIVTLNIFPRILCFQSTLFSWRHVLKICSFQKGHPNQKGGCPNTLVNPLDPPLLSVFQCESSVVSCRIVFFSARHACVNPQPTEFDKLKKANEPTIKELIAREKLDVDWEERQPSNNARRL